MMRRLKAVSLIAGILFSAATLLSWTMTWFTVTLAPGPTVAEPIAVTGEVAAPALAALGLAGLALVAALAIAGRVFRLVLGLLQAAIGVSVAWSAFGALSDPVAASAPLITETTGISGSASVAALIAQAAPSAWPPLTVALGALMALFGVFVMVTSHRWPVSASRYQSVKLDAADAPRSAVSDWDSLSDGSDPTSR